MTTCPSPSYARCRCSCSRQRPGARLCPHIVVPSPVLHCYLSGRCCRSHVPRRCAIPASPDAPPQIVGTIVNHCVYSSLFCRSLRRFVYPRTVVMYHSAPTDFEASVRACWLALTGSLDVTGRSAAESTAALHVLVWERVAALFTCRIAVVPSPPSALLALVVAAGRQLQAG